MRKFYSQQASESKTFSISVNGSPVFSTEEKSDAQNSNMMSNSLNFEPYHDLKADYKGLSSTAKKEEKYNLPFYSFSPELRAKINRAGTNNNSDGIKSSTREKYFSTNNNFPSTSNSQTAKIMRIDEEDVLPTPRPIASSNLDEMASSKLIHQNRTISSSMPNNFNNFNNFDSTTTNNFTSTTTNPLLCSNDFDTDIFVGLNGTSADFAHKILNVKGKLDGMVSKFSDQQQLKKRIRESELSRKQERIRLLKAVLLRPLSHPKVGEMIRRQKGLCLFVFRLWRKVINAEKGERFISRKDQMNGKPTLSKFLNAWKRLPRRNRMKRDFAAWRWAAKEENASTTASMQNNVRPKIIRNRNFGVSEERTKKDDRLIIIPAGDFNNSTAREKPNTRIKSSDARSAKKRVVESNKHLNVSTASVTFESSFLDLNNESFVSDGRMDLISNNPPKNRKNNILSKFNDSSPISDDLRSNSSSSAYEVEEQCEKSRKMKKQKFLNLIMNEGILKGAKSQQLLSNIAIKHYLKNHLLRPAFSFWKEQVIKNSQLPTMAKLSEWNSFIHKENMELKKKKFELEDKVRALEKEKMERRTGSVRRKMESKIASTRS